MIVMKFGGSSVKDAEKIKEVASIVKSRLDKKPVIVLSAVKGVTDNLIKALAESLEEKFDAYDEIAAKHKEILKDLDLDEGLVDAELEELKKALEVNSKVKENDAKILDYVFFFGERMSAKLLAGHLDSIGIKSEAFVSGDIGLMTDSNFGDASFIENSYEKMDDFISKLDVLPVITGFGGKDEKGEFATFNRGGSDYVAALIGAAVKAEEIQIWTDVNGVMTTDPRIVENAKTIPEISFSEASELAYFGAKVLHPKTIIPAIDKNIPVRVLNTYEPDHPGTAILNKVNDRGKIKAIARKKGITLVSINSTRMLNAHGFLAKIFAVFEKYQKIVDMISTSEVLVSLTVDDEKDLDRIQEELGKIATVAIEKDKAIICVVGEGMKNTPGIAGKVFDTVGKNDISIHMISQGASEINIGFVVDQEQADNVVKILHKEYFD